MKKCVRLVISKKKFSLSYPRGTYIFEIVSSECQQHTDLIKAQVRAKKKERYHSDKGQVEKSVKNVFNR
jgi:hypothetical protein